MSLSSTSWGGVVVSIYSSVRSGSLEMRKSLTKELMTSNAFERRCVFLEAPINASCANGLRHELTHLVATEEQTAPVDNWVGDVVAAAAAAADDDDDDDGDIGWHHVISTCTHTHTNSGLLTDRDRQTDWRRFRRRYCMLNNLRAGHSGHITEITQWLLRPTYWHAIYTTIRFRYDVRSMPTWFTAGPVTKKQEADLLHRSSIIDNVLTLSIYPYIRVKQVGIRNLALR